MRISTENLITLSVSENCSGIGTSNYDEVDGGHFYISYGNGNVENYIDFEELFELLEEDGMTYNDTVDIELNSNGEVTYMNLDVWPM